MIETVAKSSTAGTKRGKNLPVEKYADVLGIGARESKLAVKLKIDEKSTKYVRR